MLQSTASKIVDQSPKCQRELAGEEGIEYYLALAKNHNSNASTKIERERVNKFSK
jgi:hypothetical protein